MSGKRLQMSAKLSSLEVNAAAGKRVDRIYTEDLSGRMENSAPPLIVDVRDNDERGAGFIPGSFHLPFNMDDAELLKSVPTSHPVSNTPVKEVVFHCMYSSQRGPDTAERYLHSLPADSSIEVYVLRGGFQEWVTNYANDSKKIDSFKADLWKEVDGKMMYLPDVPPFLK
eukprot:GFYU01000793.1.p1 GENE.GFYU01000793.1~~GFYU01000793.1.p1  ORF type:complete len:170 (+),score=47.99 GFYU01000793.1:137-646(+)